MATSEGRITLWGIEIFVATAEEGSISAAARRLGASPATISQQLTNLETVIGTALLDRGARPMALTVAGTKFLRRANVILNEAEQARAELASADPTQLTRLRLGMIEDFDADVTPRLLGALAGDMGSCQFLLETGASHRLYDQLESRALDMIVTTDMGVVIEGAEVHPLLEEPFVVVAPKGLTSHGAPMATLGQLPLIHYTTRHHLGRMIAAHLARQDVALPYRFELDSYHAILAMVAGGAGWTILTPLGLRLAQRFRTQVEVLPLPMAPLSRSVALTARRGAFGDMPAQVADRLRALLTEIVIEPAVAERPWLAGSLRLLG